MIHKINSIKCVFENSDLENQYLDDKWKRVSSFYFKVILFFVCGSSIYLLSLFLRNTFALKNIINPIIFITFPLFLIFKNEEFNTEISFSHEIYTALAKDLHNQAKLSGETTLKGRGAKRKVYSI